MSSKEVPGQQSNAPYQGVPNPAAPGVYYDGQPTDPNSQHQQGLPGKKTLFNIYDVLAIAGSLASLAGCIGVISPSAGFDIGYNLQITVLGFLLSVQALCLRRNLQKLFLLIEARFGNSTIQNYDAIRTNSLLTDHANLSWKAVFAFFIALPIGLSLAYKQFEGGSATQDADPPGRSNQTSFYGINAPPGTYEYGSRFGVSLMSNITLPFVSTTNDDEIDPKTLTYPRPFGFNVLTLSPSKTAVLDAPHPLYLRDIQDSLAGTDSFKLTARVNATIAEHNTTIDAHRNDARWWSGYTDASLNGFLSTLTLNQGFSVWMRTSKDPDAGGPLDRSDCIIAMPPYNQHVGDANEADTFSRTAQMISVSRKSCEGQWEVTRSSVQLISGSCTNDATATSINSGFRFDRLGLPNLFLPDMLEFLGPFANISASFATTFGETRRNSPWYIPTLTTVVGTMYWSRNAALNLRSVGNTATVLDTAKYYVADAHSETRATIRTAAGLYVVVAVMPVLNLLAFVLNLLFYKSPLDANFNMVSLLAGVDGATLGVLRGAGFSGSTQQPVRMQVLVRPREDGAPVTAGAPETDVRYVVGGRGPNDLLPGRGENVTLH